MQFSIIVLIEEIVEIEIEIEIVVEIPKIAKACKCVKKIF
jgi:hypothetical protein